MADKDIAHDYAEDVSRKPGQNGRIRQLPHTSPCKPTATTDSPQSTAVSRVFETTELLENILHHVADDFYKPRKAFKGARVLVHFPAKDLFIIQRVNRKFHDTITGSINVRRLMFLEPFPEATEGLPHDCPIPLQWLLYETGFNIEGCIALGNIIRIGSCGIINRDERARDLLTNLLLLRDDERASWR